MELTSRDVEIIALLKQPNALEELSKRLNPSEEEKQSDSCKELLTERVYDTIMTSAEFGASWSEVAYFANVYRGLLQSLNDGALPDTIRRFQSECKELTQTIKNRNLLLFAEYTFLTLMQHYDLYKFTLTKPRSLKIVDYEVLVDTPIEPAPSKTSKPVHIWEYEEKYRSIEDKEVSTRLRYQEEKEGLSFKNPELNNDDLSTAAEDEAEMRAIIEQVTSAHISAFSQKLNVTIQSVMEDLDYKFEKTVLPRPQVLGPPPRFKPPTPAGQRKSKSPTKTEKPGSRGKSKESKKKAAK